MRYRYLLVFLSVLALLSLAPTPHFGQSSATITIDGYVLALESKEPIGGDVTLLEGGEHKIRKNFRTDSTGYFRIVTTAGGDKVLSAKAHGYSSQIREIDSPTSNTFTFELQASDVVDGVVEDQSGPVKGATVRALYPEEFQPLRFGHEVGEVITDDMGRFSLPSVRVGADLVLEVVKNGYQSGYSSKIAVKRGATPVVRVRLQRGFQLSGIVVDETGQPLPDARVSVQSDSSAILSDVRRASLIRARKTATTDARGRFAIDGLPGGGAILVVRCSGYRPAEFNTLVTVGETRNELSLALTRN